MLRLTRRRHDATTPPPPRGGAAREEENDRIYPAPGAQLPPSNKPAVGNCFRRPLSSFLCIINTLHNTSSMLSLCSCGWTAGSAAGSACARALAALAAGG